MGQNLYDAAIRLRESQEAKFQRVVDIAPSGFIIINTEGVVELFNPAAEIMFGYASSEVLGKNIKTLMPEPDRSHHDGYIKNYIDSGIGRIIGIGREVTGLRKDSSTFPMDLQISRIASEEEDKFFGLVTDRTEKRAFEEELLVAKDNAEKASLAKSLFLANMSHEIRTPMNAVLGYSQILFRKKSLDPDTRKALKTIDTSGKNLLTMINEILDISRLKQERWN